MTPLKQRAKWSLASKIGEMQTTKKFHFRSRIGTQTWRRSRNKEIEEYIHTQRSGKIGWWKCSKLKNWSKNCHQSHRIHRICHRKIKNCYRFGRKLEKEHDKFDRKRPLWVCFECCEDVNSLREIRGKITREIQVFQVANFNLSQEERQDHTYIQDTKGKKRQENDNWLIWNHL